MAPRPLDEVAGAFRRAGAFRNPGEEHAFRTIYAARAQEWAWETGRPVAEFWKGLKGRLDGTIPEDALSQYESQKKGPVRDRFSAEDLAQHMPRDQEGIVRMGAGMYDRAKVGTYLNSETGATAELGGGHEFTLQDPHYGKVAGANQRGAKTSQRAAQANDGLYLVYAGGPDSVLSSGHGAIVSRAEIGSALENGFTNERWLLDHVRGTLDSRHQGSWKHLEERYPVPGSLDEFLATLDRMSMPHRNQLIKAIFSKSQSDLPHWDTMRDLMTADDLRNANTGDVIAALYLAGDAPVGPASRFGVPEHPAYPQLIPGIHYGKPMEGVNIRSLFPEQLHEARMELVREVEAEGRDPSTISDGEVYVRFRRRLDYQKGRSLQGITDAERFHALTDQARLRSGFHDLRHEGGVAPHFPGVAPGDGPEVPGGVPALGGGDGRPVRRHAGPDGRLLRGRERGGRGDVLSQEGDGGPKAWYDAHRRAIGAITGRSDFSSAMHEAFHDIRRTLKEEHVRILERHFGERGTEVFEERAARAFERYLRDGKAPDLPLRRVFDAVREAMASVYRSLEGTPLEDAVHPEVRRAFDEMLGGGRREAPRARGKSPDRGAFRGGRLVAPRAASEERRERDLPTRNVSPEKAEAIRRHQARMNAMWVAPAEADRGIGPW